MPPEAASKVINQIYDEFSVHFSFTDTVVYHYTNLPALYGILNGQALWLSNVALMNDPSEISYGKELLSNISNQLPELADMRTKDVRGLFDLVAETRPRSFLLSFSREPNSLNQWREYARHPQGINIAFNTEALTTFKPHAHLVKVIYEPTLQISILSRAIELLTEQIKEVYLTPVAHESMESIFTVLMHFFQICKHPDYHTENEVRLVYFHGQSQYPLSFVQLRGQLRPIVAVPIENPALWISQVQVAPGSDPELTRIVELLLDTVIGKHGIRIVRSPTPFRP